MSEYITLQAWAAKKFNPVPHPNTLRRWAGDGMIVPKPFKVGREYMVLPTAGHVAEPEADPQHEQAPCEPTPEVTLSPTEWLKEHWRELVFTPKQIREGAIPIYSLPGASGVYLVLDGNGRVEYVGSSVFMNRRGREHERNWPTATAFPIAVPPHWMRQVEHAYIKVAQPHLNRNLTSVQITAVPFKRALMEAWKC